MTSKEIINKYIKDCEDSLTCMHNPKIMKQQMELIKEMELIKKDLEILDVIKKFFFIEAYSDKRLNADFCKITAIEDKEANIDNSALSFIDGDSLKILKEGLENDYR